MREIFHDPLVFAGNPRIFNHDDRRPTREITGMNKPLKDRRYPEIKYRDLLAVIGSDRQVQDALRNYGYDVPSIRVIEGWRSRNSVPPRWLPLLLQHAMNRGDVRKPEELLKAPV